MKLTLEPTDAIGEFIQGDQRVRARCWTGTDGEGVPVTAWILAVSPQTHDPEVEARFDRELEARTVRGSPRAYDIRFFID